MSKPIPKAPWISQAHPLKMGLRAATDADWLFTKNAFDSPASATQQIKEKAQLLDTHFDDVFMATDESLLPATELYELVRDILQTHHGIDISKADTEHPLLAAAKAVPEDLLLLAPSPKQDQTGEYHNQWQLAAACLAFPSHWRLADKFQRPMIEIHEPVPGYGDILGHPVNRFFDRMLARTVSQRRNWTVQIDDHLFTPVRHESAPLLAEDCGDRLFVRVEHQSLRKLDRSGWIVFAIRSAIAPLSTWEEDKTALALLYEALRQMPADMQAYRGLESYLPQLRQWLAARGLTLSDWRP